MPFKYASGNGQSAGASICSAESTALGVCPNDELVIIFEVIGFVSTGLAQLIAISTITYSIVKKSRGIVQQRLGLSKVMWIIIESGAFLYKDSPPLSSDSSTMQGPSWS
jgi:hypothetical protein